MSSFVAGPMEQLRAERLFGKMKGRKKRATKRARIEPPQASTPELEQPVVAPPVIDLEESENHPSREPGTTAEPVLETTTEPAPETTTEPAPETTAEPAPKTTTEPASMPETTSGSEGTARSILNPQYSLRKSKGIVCAEEVSEWAELSPAQLGAQAATHCMVVNNAVHALTYQSDST
ncbi:PREDICTED: proteoglycan 4-like [Nelumbo nucifera]|uniref:Proteoglycan 4-like n=1 Tax=Nelumbo nucifera TaxID=4432 RepID=A0A1U7ZMU1_NELNU|nr:PREDICTED: proteoglycan 4-like [Nelumbo nucifera]